jgi:hypothetical protein
LPNYVLREDTLEHFMQWINDWYMVGQDLDKYNHWQKHLNLKVISPFYMNGLNDFLLSLPYEYCDCLGFARHVYREAIGDLLPPKIMSSIRGGMNADINWYNKNINQFKDLYKKYILPEERLINRYIKSDDIQNLFKNNFNKITSKNYKNFFRCYNLINLAVWLEINND